MQTRMANIVTVMNLDKNMELVSAETLKLNERFNVFENLRRFLMKLRRFD